jgi:hypothetical protein
MDTIDAIQILPVFKRLHKKGRARTQAEEKEYQEMLAKYPSLNDILLLEQYTELVEMPGRSNVQEAALQAFLTDPRYKKIVAMYERLKSKKPLFGKSRSRRHRRLTRRKRTSRK